MLLTHDSSTLPALEAWEEDGDDGCMTTAAIRIPTSAVRLPHVGLLARLTAHFRSYVAANERHFRSIYTSR